MMYDILSKVSMSKEINLKRHGFMVYTNHLFRSAGVAQSVIHLTLNLS